MEEKVKALQHEVESFLVKSKEDLENFRLKFISKKGQLMSLFDDLKLASVEEKKKLGKTLNDLKQLAENRFKSLQESIENTTSSDRETKDLSLPVVPNKTGNLHPLNLTRYRIIEIFERLGFNVSDGPEIEDDWHNFTALNFPGLSIFLKITLPAKCRTPFSWRSLPVRKAGIQTCCFAHTPPTCKCV